MQYYKVPQEIKFCWLNLKDYSLSPSMYKSVNIKNENKPLIRELLDDKKPFEKGVEPGRQWYMKDSPYRFIRTKALQEHNFTLYPKGECIIPINPSKYVDIELKKGDILLSKDSNIGECALIYGEEAKNADISGGIVRLNVKPEVDRYYLFALMKHPIFKEQLSAMVPKGATIKHAGDRWLNCRIPFPNKNNHSIVKWVSTAVKVIASMELEISVKTDMIFNSITNELLKNQKKPIIYNEPHFETIEKEARLDAAIYCKEYVEKISLIENYSLGYLTPTEYGFTVIPGPSLEIKLLKVRIDSETPREDYYKLILPTNISEYGTMNKIQFMGTPKKLPLLHKGDIIFGEAGFQKGRSLVLTEEIPKCTTNAHGLYARRYPVNMKDSYYFRCIFDWYRRQGLIDLMAVGGSGGHFSPEYFDYIRIPNFPQNIIDSITRYYCIDDPDIYVGDDLNLVLNNDIKKMGIVQLDAVIKCLKTKLYKILENIINDNEQVIEEIT